MMKAANLLVACLEREGIDRIYGVPGEENADMLMALEESSIEVILTRHEQGAAFMAATYGRLTGKVGVCFGTLGPGATNLITGVADGNMDRAPVLVITGQAATTRQHKESHQVMNVLDMFKPVTKWSHAIISAENIPEIVRKSVKLATTEKPGAVHLELPEDIAAQHVDAAVKPLTPSAPRRPVPDDKSIDMLWSLLKKAKSPLIIAGNGAIRTRASNQLRELTQRTGIGVLMTFMAKGAVDLKAQECLFTIGMGQKDYPLLAIEAADLIITVGYDMVEYSPADWNPNADKCIAHIDFLPAEIDAHYQPDVEIVGDLAHALWMLNTRIDQKGIPAFAFEKQQYVRETMEHEFAADGEGDSADLITPQKAIQTARDCLGPHDVLLSGVGAHKMWIARHYQCHEPNTCIISNGFCSMGLPLPGAIAAAHARPGVKILGIAGDGDFLMNVQEMETAKRLGVDITMMIWEDKEYGLIAWKQEQEFGNHTPLSFDNPDWVALGNSFGWSASRCGSSADLQNSLETALNESGPSLLAIPIDYRENMKLTQRLGDLTARL